MASIVISGDTSGSITLSAPAVSGSSVLTLPAVTDTVAGIAATQTLTNKTLTSPTLVTPALGTPASGVVTNLTGTASININGTVGATTASTGAFTTLSATGVTTVQAGTAALPAITTTGDTNTGIFFSAADTIDFTEGGVATGQFDSSGNFKFNSGYGSVAVAYACRAWVNFNGTGTVAIRASGNVSSITDNGTGDYTINFTTAMPDVNYGFAGMGRQDGANAAFMAPGTSATSSFRFQTYNEQSPPQARDFNPVSVQIFR
jgi:hypothetical protein